jgi:hypothetical protein
MKLTKKMLREVTIYNSHDYAQGNAYLYYSPQELGRITRPSQWVVYQKGKKFSDAWYDHGAMTFMLWRREEKEEKFNEAVAWMKSYLGIQEVKRTPMGSWMEKSFVEKRNKEIEELYKAQKTTKIGA